MNKDAIVAATIGFSLGLVVAIGLWIGPRFIKSGNQQQISFNTNNPTSSASKIILKSPTSGDVVKNKTVTLEGSAPVNDLMVITSPVQEVITQTAPDGSFGTSIALEEGENELTITAYSPTGEAQDSIVASIIYTSENL